MTPDFELEFIQRNHRFKHVLKHLRLSLGKNHVTWSDITKLNMERFSAYLMRTLSQNSARTYLAVMKAFIARFDEEGLMPCPNPKIRIASVPSQHIALTIDELHRLDAYRPQNQLEADVKAIFMRGCLTGARFTDAASLTTANICGGSVVYISRKTHTETCLPLHAMLPKYLAPLSSVPNCMSVNRTIKRICRKIGMTDEVQLFVEGGLRKGKRYEFVSEHTSRRTFCTILASLNVPTEYISKYAGHSNSAITSSRYICLDTANAPSEALHFFGLNPKS